MSVLGVIVRPRPGTGHLLRATLESFSGVAVSLEAPDGRLVLIIEDSGHETAAATLAAIAGDPLVVHTSLVYEHSLDDPTGAWRNPRRDNASLPGTGQHSRVAQ